MPQHLTALRLYVPTCACVRVCACAALYLDPSTPPRMTTGIRGVLKLCGLPAFTESIRWVCMWCMHVCMYVRMYT
jgi:hypothetical protein